jgi:RNA polymerase sigma-B factor
MSASGAEARIATTRQEQERVWRRFAAGRDPADRERLFELYLPVARRMASRYAGVAEPYDDLLQVAGLGLLNAIDRFDPANGTPFLGFAKPTIMGELKRHLRDKVWTVRVPRSLHDRMGEVGKRTDELTLELGRPPSIAEIAADLDIEANEVLETLEAKHNRRPLSLDAPIGDGHDEDGSTSPEWVGDVDGGYELIEGRVSVERLLPDLDPREREILRLRFVEDLSQARIAARLGCSQMQVSRLLRATLERLREEAAR